MDFVDKCRSYKERVMSTLCAKNYKLLARERHHLWYQWRMAVKDAGGHNYLTRRAEAQLKWADQHAHDWRIANNYHEPVANMHGAEMWRTDGGPLTQRSASC